MEGERGVTWNFDESPPTIVIVQIYIRVCIFYGYDVRKNRKASCRIICCIVHTRLNPIYSCAGGSTISYVYSYQVRNTLLRINYLTCLVSNMVSSGFGPYHGMSLEDAQTKCVGIIPTPWTMPHALGLVQFPPQHE